MVPRDMEMLPGAAKEGLDFPLQDHDWLWMLCTTGCASRSWIVPQACIKGQHSSAWMQYPQSLPTSGGLGSVMDLAKMLQSPAKPLPELEGRLDQPPASSRLFRASIDTRNKSLQSWAPLSDCPLLPPAPQGGTSGPKSKCRGMQQWEDPVFPTQEALVLPTAYTSSSPFLHQLRPQQQCLKCLCITALMVIKALRGSSSRLLWKVVLPKR